jgi:Leucine-rich repeat (LRR) protein
MTQLVELRLWLFPSDAQGLTDFDALEVAVAATIPELAKLKNLEVLEISVFAKPHLDQIQGLTKLRELSVSADHIEDHDLAHLKNLANLEKLNFAVSRITDTGLMQLRGLSRLRELDVRYSDVTDKGASELEKAIPSLRVKYGR